MWIKSSLQDHHLLSSKAAVWTWVSLTPEVPLSPWFNAALAENEQVKKKVAYHKEAEAPLWRGDFK